MRGLLDMPIDIIEKILKKLEHGERAKFRNVSRACRQTFDSINYTFETVEFSGYRNNVWLIIENCLVEYQRRNILRQKDRSIIKKCTVNVKLDEDPWSKALEEFTRIFGNPKHLIQELHFNYKGQLSFITGSLKSLGHQLNVNSFEFSRDFDGRYNARGEIQTQTMEILPFLKAGVLEDLSFECLPDLTDHPKMFFKKVIKTDQWKQAKRLFTNFCTNMKLSDLMHFRRLDVNFGSIKTKDAMYIRDNCKNFPGFENYSFRANVDSEKILEKFGSEAIALDDNSIQDGFLLISVTPGQITFEKMNQ
ncbi:unnamed protein product [Caenorhabditis brenneri]